MKVYYGRHVHQGTVSSLYPILEAHYKVLWLLVEKLSESCFHICFVCKVFAIQVMFQLAIIVEIIRCWIGTGYGLRSLLFCMLKSY
jgi:hypothetical protein